MSEVRLRPKSPYKAVYSRTLNLIFLPPVFFLVYTDFLYTQTDMCFLLADSLVERMSRLWIPADAEEQMERDRENGGSSLDPRALGVELKYATDEMKTSKIMVADCLLAGTKIALSAKDEYGFQNAAIYFWNLHIHIFRKSLYQELLPEALEVLKLICSCMESFKASNGAYLVDEKLRVFYIEALATLHQQKGDLSQAVDVVNKASANGTPYIRRKLCELAGKLSACPVPAGGKGAAKVYKQYLLYYSLFLFNSTYAAFDFFVSQHGIVF